MEKPNYREEYLRMLEENFENFDIKEKSIQYKIDNFCEKFSSKFEKSEVYKKLEEDEILKAWFIKDPAKQNVYEKTFGNFLKSLPGVKNFERLKSSGKGSIFIEKQTVKTRKEIPGNPRPKCMDFCFEFESVPKKFYVFHKYTNEPGGAQDNQRNDVITAIMEASCPQSINENIMVLFVCDGDYYKKEGEKIKENIRDKNFKLLESSEIQKFLEKEFK